ncbi:MAG: FtsX-like permease family protein, partial [Acidobacteriota bacterium]
GALAGLVLAWLASDRLGLPLGADLPPWVEVTLDQRVLLVTLGVSILVGLVTSVLPAIQAARTDPARALSAGGRSGSGGRRRAARVLVIAQAALAIVLMVAAALVTQSFSRLQATDLGFDTGRMLTFEVRLAWKSYQDDERTWAFWRNLQDRLRALPGVDAVSTLSALPFADVDPFPVSVDGLDAESQRRLPPVQFRYAEVGAFEMLGVATLTGRTFDAGDRDDTQRVTVLSRRLAERLFPGRTALGERVKFGRPDSRWPWMEVVGVVEDVRYFGAASTPGFDLYVSPRQNAHNNAFVMVSTSIEPSSLADEAARAVLAIDPDQSSTDYRTLEDRWAASLWRQRLATRLIGLFAGLAAILATVGLYALLAWSVRERRRELALRCALGAERRTIVRMVLRDALTLAGQGVGIGLVLVLFGGRLLDALLWEIDATDLPTLVATPLVLIALTVAAAWLPAVRAARVEVVTTLDAD